MAGPYYVTSENQPHPTDNMSTTHNADTDYLIDYSADSSNHELLILTHCPICHTRLIDDLDEWKHGHDDPVADHIATHSPTDLDLDGPYHFTPMADILIRLHGLDAD